jgi:hypothetical protein
MRKFLKIVRNVVLFFAYFWLVFSVIAENVKEWACKRCSLNQEHKWIQTSNIERGNTRIYARCRRCKAVR